MMAANAMSKLIDSLTGYLFPHADGATDGDATAVADPGPTPGLRSRLLRRPVHRSIDGADTQPPTMPWGDDYAASPRVHPSAVIHPLARLAPDVEVGPFCVIGPHVTLGPGCRLLNGVTILGHTTAGSDNVFHPGCVVGNDPQDKKFRGEPTRLVMGDANHVREHVTIHAGTVTGGGVTAVGDNNLLMVNAHVGHDATLGSDCVIGNNVMLAGHVRVGDRVSMMGGSACHHFVTIGDYAFIGGYAQVHIDVPPYLKVDGHDVVRAVNAVGLRRGGVSDEDIAALELAHRRLFGRKSGPIAVTIREMLAEPDLNPRVREVVDSIRRRALGKHGRYLEGDRRA